MKSKLYIGARVVFTTNINTSGHSVNRSTRKIEYMQMSRAENGLFGIIYVNCVNLDVVISVKKKVFKRLIEEFFTNHSYYLNISVLLQEWNCFYSVKMISTSHEACHYCVQFSMFYFWIYERRLWFHIRKWLTKYATSWPRSYILYAKDRD